MTPDPKYFATKKTQSGTSFERMRFAKMGNMAPMTVSGGAESK